MLSYEAIIGLEIHAELATKTKLFCACKNEFGARANTNICPICTGQPGTLPSVNREAVRLALRAACVFDCEVNKLSKQCRKHYFYPDLPKGYQISQRETPIGIKGRFSYLAGGEVKTCGIRQVHIEEDAGKLVHRDDGTTGVDYNRAGVPLIEIVTEPELHSAAEARAFMEAVRLSLIRAGVSDCRMEQGSLRCDVNVSLRRKGEASLNERVEMKNINTFSGAERAIEYEISRQVKMLNSGFSVPAETRRWDDEKRESFLMRTKETVIDYKFMPEPDIPVYLISDEEILRAGENLPESDISRRKRYLSLGVSENDCTRLCEDVELSRFFDKCQASTAADECAKLLVGEILAILSKEHVLLSGSKLAPEELIKVAELIKTSLITRDSAKKILSELIKHGGSAGALSEKHTLISDKSVIENTISAVLAENAKAVSDYAGGKESAITYLIGQCMRALSGRADAELIKDILINKLKGGEKC